MYPEIIYSIDEVKKAAKGFFFEPDTMRSFSSRVLSDVFDGPNGCFFVTSEKFRGFRCENKPRLYTVRRLDRVTGLVDTAPGHEFQEFKSRTGALGAARRAAADSPEAMDSWTAERKAEARKRNEDEDARRKAWLVRVNGPRLTEN